MSRSAFSSTYTWQIAVIVLDHWHSSVTNNGFDERMTATRNDEIDVLIHRRDDRHRLPLLGGNELDCILRQALRMRRPACSASAMARFEFSASEPPRRITAFPVLMQSTAASLVTFGRDS